MSRAFRPADFFDFSSTSPMNSSSIFVPRSYHHPPGESGTGGGANPFGNTPVANHENTGVNYGYFAQPPDNFGFVGDNRTYQQSLGDPGVRPVDLYQPSISPLFQQGRSLPGREGQQWATPGGGSGQAQQQLGMQPLDRELLTDAHNFSRPMMPRHMDRYASDSHSPSQSPGYDSRGSLLGGQDTSYFGVISNSPSPSSDYGAAFLRDSPGNSPLALSPTAPQSTTPPAFDPQIEQWIRREVGLHPSRPVNLSSIEDYPPTQRPPLPLKWIMALAICGTPGKKITLNRMYEAIEAKFPYYRADKDKKWQRSIRHSLSLYSMFIHEPRPIAESGKGGYWQVIYVAPGMNQYKRERKRKSGSVSGNDSELENFSDEGNISQDDQPQGNLRNRSPHPYPQSSSSSSSAQRAAQSSGYTQSPYPRHGHGRQQPTFGHPSLFPAQQFPVELQQRPGPTRSHSSPVHSTYGPMAPVRPTTRGQNLGFDTGSGQVMMPPGQEPYDPRMTPGGPTNATGKSKRRTH